MVEEEGIVKTLEGQTAGIATEESNACDSCTTKSVCQSSEEGERLVIAVNSVGAKVGDRVKFTVAAGNVIKTGMLVYLLPLIGFITGIVGGQVFGPRFLQAYDKDIVSAALGFALLFLVYFFVVLYGNAAEKKNKFMPRITEIL
jgi:sigma-E factor negative regulatory protein RseC